MNVPVLLVLFLFLSAASSVAADEREDRLTPTQKAWLEREAVYLITELEKESFLDIEASDVRDAFIEAFWKRRDPNPATLENEFKTEHFRRMEHANTVLSRETARPGWRTDRGRFYIILGEPQSVQRYDRDNVVPMELWFYETDGSRGLPPFFYLLFFQRRSFGEFELYDPSADGPKALVQGGLDRIPDNRAALEILREIDIEVSRAAVSFDPAERGYVDAVTVVSGATHVLLANIEEAPKRAARTDYIRGWERYGSRVGAEYSFNFVPNRSTFTVLAGPADTSFVHYSIEIDPQNFNLQTDEDGSRYYTVVDVTVEVRTHAGASVVKKDREIFFQLTPSEFAAVQSSPVAIQGAFPLVPGGHHVSVIARNRVMKQFTVAERNVFVPDPARSPTPGLSDVLLGYDRELVGEDTPGEVRPFRVGGVQFRPAADGVFALGDTAYVVLHAGGAAPTYQVRFSLVGAGETVLEQSFPLSRYTDGVIDEAFPLAVETAGNYELHVTLIDTGGAVASEQTATMRLSPRTAIARAGYLSREGFNGAVPGLVALERAEQLLGLGRTEQGVAELEKAVAADNPDLPMARWKLAAVRVAEGDADGALALLLPMEASYPRQFEVIAGLGFARYHQQDFDQAEAYLDRAMSLRPAYPALLNALADCYERTGQKREALATFERSLALNENQPVVRERVEALKAEN